MAVYYNEWDPFMAQWLRKLIEAGHLPPGDVDERDIREITPDDLKGYTQHHFFAGVGGWSEALFLAGWPADRPVWTGSCPCQPFSTAGKGLGEKDERHLWPVWFQLIRKCQPSTVFGEQVASKAGREWLSGVRTDLETVGYAVGAADLCAASVGSPQIRQRLWWMGIANGEGSQSRQQTAAPMGHGNPPVPTSNDVGGLPKSDSNRTQRGEKDSGGEAGCETGGVSDASIGRNRAYDGQSGAGTQPQIPAGGHDLLGGISDSESKQMGDSRQPREGTDTVSGISDADSSGSSSQQGDDGEVCSISETECQPEHSPIVPRRSCTVSRLRDTESERRYRREDTSEQAGWTSTEESGYWSYFDIIPYQDGEDRRVEPGTFPLAHGVPNRVGRLRGYGNAIVPQVAAVFIRACREGEGSPLSRSGPGTGRKH